ncbi:MAG: hypothetical protein CBD16_02260 [Betaproteobacteria bacterium TMED156]|nr:MAG: hypothetical protein CBD16_02260 [Betaproteobacteria bacterium TMED156]
MTFFSLGLAPIVLKDISAMGFSDPTPIQKEAITKIMVGKDVLGIAQTGTGKTGAFLIPIIHRLQKLANTSTSPARHPVRSIILAPTRELADQIYNNAKSFTLSSSLRVGVVFGGVSIDQQTQFLNQGLEILIATPGRLLDHINQKNLRLESVSILTLDEADRMLDMGFLPDLQKIISLIPSKRQSLLFSATFSNEIKKFSKTILNSNYELVQVSKNNSTAITVDQTIYKLDNYEEKKKYIYQLINKRLSNQILVFVNTKLEASRLANYLDRRDILANSIHGNKSQSDRLTVLQSFKTGEIRVLVATDVAARGLDIEELPVVINFDIPFLAEDYIHRVGRTGRAGSSGIAISLMVPDDDTKIIEIEKLINRKIRRNTVEVKSTNKKEVVQPITNTQNNKKNILASFSSKSKNTKKHEKIPILLMKKNKIKKNMNE